MPSPTTDVNELLKKCVQCGSCLPICPIFRVVEEEGISPRSKLYFLKIKDEFPEQFDEELEREYAQAIFTCACCGRCEEICTSDVSLLDIFKKIRHDLITHYPKLQQIEQNIAVEHNVYGIDNELRAEAWLMELYDDLPDIDDRVYDEGKKADTILFIGCLMSFRSRHAKVLKAIFRIMEELDEDYLILGGEEFCCGHPLDLLGETAAAKNVRKHNSAIFQKIGAKTIVTDCPGCLEALKEHHTISKDVRILHLTEFFDEKIDTVPHKLDITLKYHDPCELFRNNKIKEAPRSLMKKMGIQLIEMEPSCCGGGGMLRVSDEPIANAVLQQRIEKEGLREEKIDVVTCCPSCLEQYELNEIVSWDIVEWLELALFGDKEEK
jgi:Fe-S oxidoreductase